MSERRNCPTCGASTSSVVAHCEYCGTELSGDAKLSPQEHVAALAKAFASADRYSPSDQQAAIAAMPIPTDLQVGLAFFLYCHGNVKDGLEGSDPTNIAWRYKAKVAYDSLRLAALNNSQLSEFLRDFQEMYSAAGINQFQKANTMVWIYTLGGAVTFFALVALLVKFG